METPTLVDRQTLAACLLLCEPLYEKFMREPKPRDAWKADHGMRLWIEAITKYRKHFKEMPNISIMTMLIKTLLSKAEWAQDYTDETPQHNLLLQGGMDFARKMINDPQEKVEETGTKLLIEMQRHYLATNLLDRINRDNDLKDVVEYAGRH